MDESATHGGGDSMIGRALDFLLFMVIVPLVTIPFEIAGAVADVFRDQFRLWKQGL